MKNLRILNKPITTHSDFEIKIVIYDDKHDLDVDALISKYDIFIMSSHFNNRFAKQRMSKIYDKPNKSHIWLCIKCKTKEVENIIRSINLWDIRQNGAIVNNIGSQDIVAEYTRLKAIQNEKLENIK
jgi:hypothetical protein